MNDQDWSPFADEPPAAPRPAPSPGRVDAPPHAAARPSPYPQYGTPPSPTPGSDAPGPPPQPTPPPPSSRPEAYPAHDQTAPLRPPSAARPGQPGLIPEPDATAILPQIPATADPAPAGAQHPARKKQSVKRHRGADGGGARKAVRGVGEVLVTFGVVVLLYAAYEVFGVSGEINSQQSDLSSDLDVIWDNIEAEDEGAPIPELGDAFARMWAPDIRAESWTLVEGTELSDIEYAPGRYLDGAYPGEQGNFTLAGHNVPAIFQKIRDLEYGDKVVIETKDHFYVYEVTEHVVVDETQVEITEPVPGEPGVEPGEQDYWMTLFTCHPLWDNYERYVVYSTLVDTVERDPDGELPDAAVDPEA